MKKTLITLLTLFTAFNLFADRPAKPNVVLILIDDLGWQDVKCYDIDEPSPMETPNMDALATKGVMFWQGYSPAPVCAPSRAAILSGLHPARGDMTHVAGGNPPHPGNLHAAQIQPYYSARMPIERYTLAEAMKAEGYATAHSGKWHISQHHYDYPNPYHHGFDISTHDRGVQYPMSPDRLTGFATRDPNDPHRLDENGFPFDIPQDAAMTFIRENRDKPFFLYYATWLVHAPIVMRSEALLRKYEQKLGVTLTDEHKDSWKKPGQTNPFYCAMVEQLDYYLGQIFTYLETTEDPRWPGHQLVENTYIIFTSDNGGMEGGGNEIYTDNYPLDRGKISLREGGTRVPLIITGPDIPAGVQTDVMANGLDFYPTILSMIGAKKPEGKIFDGCDLVPLLTKDPTNPALVRDAEGKVRDTMVWHFPQAENTSSLRVGDYKVFRRYHGVSSTAALHRLYNAEGDETVRGDIEEMKDLAAEMPGKTAELDAQLTEIVKEMGGRRPYGNPSSPHDLPNKEKAPAILGHQQDGKTVEVTYKNNGAGIAYADLIYTPNNGREWLRASGRLEGDDKAVFGLPAGTSHYFINLVDENNFLAIYPPIDRPKMKQDNLEFQDVAVFAGYPEPEQGAPINLGERFKKLSAADESAVVFMSENLEDEATTSISTTDAGISLTDAHAASGKRCIVLSEEDFPQDWMPMISHDFTIPEDKAAGTLTVSCDVMLDQENPGKLKIFFRDHKSGKSRRDGDGAEIGDGVLKAGSWAVTAVEPGTWYHLEIKYGGVHEGGKTYTVSATTADGRTARAVIPYSDQHFNRPDWVGISGMGSTGSRVYVDNITVRVED